MKPPVGQLTCALGRPSLNFDIIGNPNGPNNVVNRLNPDGAALGHGACLNGEATGWTFERLAPQTCCAGTKFHPLTPQEAYAKYEVSPILSDVITNALVIGVCLKYVTGAHNG